MAKCVFNWNLCATSAFFFPYFKLAPLASALDDWPASFYIPQSFFFSVRSRISFFFSLLVNHPNRKVLCWFSNWAHARHFSIRTKQKSKMVNNQRRLFQQQQGRRRSRGGYGCTTIFDVRKRAASMYRQVGSQEESFMCLYYIRLSSYIYIQDVFFFSCSFFLELYIELASTVRSKTNYKRE